MINRNWILLMLVSGAWLPNDASTEELSLKSAIADAVSSDPALRAAQVRAENASQLADVAGTFQYNPEISLQGNARNGDKRKFDWQVGLSQTFEISGQASLRSAVAQAEKNRLEAELKDRKLRVIARVRTAFVTAQAQREMLDISLQELAVAQQLVELSRRRVRAGAGTELEVFLAKAELGKVQEIVNKERGLYVLAQSDLALTIGRSPDHEIVTSGEIPKTCSMTSASLESLIAKAKTNRFDLTGAKFREIASQRAVELADAASWSTIAIGIFAGQEADGEETLLGSRLSLPIPLFNRNQSDRARALGEFSIAKTETATRELEVVREVVASYRQYASACDSLTIVHENVGDNAQALAALNRMFETGKSSWVEVLIMRRSVFDAQRSHVRVALSAAQSEILLELAIANTPEDL